MPQRPGPVVLLVALLALVPALAAADGPEPIRYTVRFPRPRTHYAEVEATFPTGGRPEVELMMAVWTPGSYLVREFARHVEGLAARTPEGKPLAAEKVRKNRWKVGTAGAAAVVVSYRVYGREMGVQTNWIDDDFALLNGAPTFLTLADDRRARPHEVTLVPPPGWRRTVSGLPAASGGGAHRYVAPDYDTLVDSPIYAGNPAVYEFKVDGKPHYLVNEGEGGIWDGPRSARDVEAIVRAHRDFWGPLPYDK